MQGGIVLAAEALRGIGVAAEIGKVYLLLDHVQYLCLMTVRLRAALSVLQYFAYLVYLLFYLLLLGFQHFGHPMAPINPSPVVDLKVVLFGE